MKISPLTKKHWPAVAEIYDEGLKTSLATFETKVPTWHHWDEHHLPICRIVAEENNQILGWAALSLVSHRPVYRGVCEVSIYLKASARGKGQGRVLLNELVVLSEKNKIWTLQAVIFPENKASIKLHEHCGFRVVGLRERVGQLHGEWRNTVLMERRSNNV